MNQKNIHDVVDQLKRIAHGVDDRETPFGVYQAVGEIRDNLKQLNGNIEKLNVNIEKIDNSSTKLSRALNYITLAGVIISAIALLPNFIKWFISFFNQFN